ncbi:hypothetical protein, partial [Aeromonas media]|uniref:hypothetical protein n=1 Tax=Aeromonas media TaxID=651 RepID=UPI001E36530D
LSEQHCRHAGLCFIRFGAMVAPEHRLGDRWTKTRQVVDLPMDGLSCIPYNPRRKTNIMAP